MLQENSVSFDFEKAYMQAGYSEDAIDELLKLLKNYKCTTYEKMSGCDKLIEKIMCKIERFRETYQKFQLLENKTDIQVNANTFKNEVLKLVMTETSWWQVGQNKSINLNKACKLIDDVQKKIQIKLTVNVVMSQFLQRMAQMQKKYDKFAEKIQQMIDQYQ